MNHQGEPSAYSSQELSSQAERFVPHYGFSALGGRAQRRGEGCKEGVTHPLGQSRARQY